MGQRITALALLAVVALAVGCSPARYVMRDAYTGVVAIPANTNHWPSHNRDAARELMKEHFPDGYVIDREEEVVVGQSTHYSEDHEGSEVRVGGPGPVEVGASGGSVDGRITTRDETEYRIYYRRR